MAGEQDRAWKRKLKLMQDEMDEKAKKWKSDLDDKIKKLEEKNNKLLKDFDEQKKELGERQGCRKVQTSWERRLGGQIFPAKVRDFSTK